MKFLIPFLPPIQFLVRGHNVHCAAAFIELNEKEKDWHSGIQHCVRKRLRIHDNRADDLPSLKNLY